MTQRHLYNSALPNEAIWRHSTWQTLVQVLACGLRSAKPSPEPMLTCCQLNHREPWWRHQMETFSALLAFCEGYLPFNGGFPSQSQGVLVFYLISVWTNGWAKNRDIGDLRRHRIRYDGIVITVKFHSTYAHFLSRNALRYIVCKMSAILSRAQCRNGLTMSEWWITCTLYYDVYFYIVTSYVTCISNYIHAK